MVEQQAGWGTRPRSGEEGMPLGYYRNPIYRNLHVANTGMTLNVTFKEKECCHFATMLTNLGKEHRVSVIALSRMKQS